MTETRTCDLNVKVQHPKKGSNKKKPKKKSQKKPASNKAAKPSEPVLSVQERMEEVYKGKETRKIHTYDKGTGYFITSVFPVLSSEECKEQAVSITEEIITLMENS